LRVLAARNRLAAVNIDAPLENLYVAHGGGSVVRPKRFQGDHQFGIAPSRAQPDRSCSKRCQLFKFFVDANFSFEE
jgi:hypothetical protein